ncbi:hypothetical protein JAO73_04550 [Hymenobacter sp. BT523]|uniref:hypothetical protein n=1 Tax=Hymenobacter sp. BT523 TaxID=2795725 RepID=UPI0018EB4985|nr:hypothetical protein [Hymenobacter sp. BT523]MBJ6108268.1 hypothetical protein [Hymenobacter sp. BT523]
MPSLLSDIYAIRGESLAGYFTFLVAQCYGAKGCDAAAQQRGLRDKVVGVRVLAALFGVCVWKLCEQNDITIL